MRTVSYMVSIALLMVFLAMTIASYFYQSKEKVGLLIAHDVEQLVSIFERIDKTCDIISFDYQKNPINFLNVKSFVGSEVGPMNVAYPQSWQGPYLADNPTIEGREYQIVRTKAGYFVAPGEGVKLPNGKVIGKDIILDEKVDMMALARDESMLAYKGKALAAPINIRMAPTDQLVVSEDMI